MDLLGLALTTGIGPKRLKQILEVSKEPTPELVENLLGPELAASYKNTLAGELARHEREKAKAHGVRLVGLWEESYPQALKHLDSPPLVLYLKGELPAQERAVGIVGTRRASAWARAWTHRVAKELAEAGVAVVSGLARGIDTEAHQGALEAGGLTLGVLGSGIDLLYPPENKALAEKMSLASEFPFGTQPQAELFPRRNRIIAALSKAVLVVEAGVKSGALITAKFALELGREVLAVPGRPTDAFSEGVNQLIRDGAQMALSAADVLYALGMVAPSKEARTLVGHEALVYRTLLELGEALPDDLAEASGLGPGEVLSVLSLLEIKGMARAIPGGRYLAGA